MLRWVADGVVGDGGARKEPADEGLDDGADEVDARAADFAGFFTRDGDGRIGVVRKRAGLD